MDQRWCASVIMCDLLDRALLPPSCISPVFMRMCANFEIPSFETKSSLRHQIRLSSICVQCFTPQCFRVADLCPCSNQNFCRWNHKIKFESQFIINAERGPWEVIFPPQYTGSPQTINWKRIQAKDVYFDTCHPSWASSTQSRLFALMIIMLAVMWKSYASLRRSWKASEDLNQCSTGHRWPD